MQRRSGIRLLLMYTVLLHPSCYISALGERWLCNCDGHATPQAADLAGFQ